MINNRDNLPPQMTREECLASIQERIKLKIKDKEFVINRDSVFYKYLFNKKVKLSPSIIDYGAQLIIDEPDTDAEKFYVGIKLQFSNSFNSTPIKVNLYNSLKSLVAEIKPLIKKNEAPRLHPSFSLYLDQVNNYKHNKIQMVKKNLIQLRHTPGTINQWGDFLKNSNSIIKKNDPPFQPFYSYEYQQVVPKVYSYVEGLKLLDNWENFFSKMKEEDLKNNVIKKIMTKELKKKEFFELITNLVTNYSVWAKEHKERAIASLKQYYDNRIYYHNRRFDLQTLQLCLILFLCNPRIKPENLCQKLLTLFEEFKKEIPESFNEIENFLSILKLTHPALAYGYSKSLPHALMNIEGCVFTIKKVLANKYSDIQVKAISYSLHNHLTVKINNYWLPFISKVACTLVNNPNVNYKHFQQDQKCGSKNFNFFKEFFVSLLKNTVILDLDKISNKISSQLKQQDFAMLIGEEIENSKDNSIKSLDQIKLKEILLDNKRKNNLNDYYIQQVAIVTFIRHPKINKENLYLALQSIVPSLMLKNNITEGAVYKWLRNLKDAININNQNTKKTQSKSKKRKAEDISTLEDNNLAPENENNPTKKRKKNEEDKMEIDSFIPKKYRLTITNFSGSRQSLFNKKETTSEKRGPNPPNSSPRKSI